MVMKKLKCSVLVLLMLMTASLSLFAKDYRYKSDTVTTRERPELDPLGARAGAFRLFPKLEISETYSDNIFATNNNEESDFITTIKPSLNMESLWGRHSLSFHTDATIGRYADNEDESFEDYSAGFDGQLEINHAQHLSSGYLYSHEHEKRSSPDDALGVKPTEIDINNFFTTYQHRFNNIIFELAGEFQSLDYDDVRSATGNIIDNDDRDRKKVEGSLKVAYEYLPDYAAYVRTSINKINYDQDIDNNNFNRDSDGYAISIGTDLDLTGVLYGNLFVGYETQRYDDPALDDTKGVSGGASLTWLPSYMTTVTGSLTRSIEETTLDSASGVFSTGFQIIVDHELLRNLLLQARVSLSEDDFEGINRSDTYFESGFGATYMLNRHLSLLLDYDFHQRKTDLINGADEFSENIFSIGGQIQL